MRIDPTRLRTDGWRNDRQFHALVQTFKDKLYHPTDPSVLVKQQIVEKIAGTGLSYQHMEDILEKFGEKALIGVLSLPPGNRSFRLPPVRLRLDSIRLRTVCQFAYVLSNYCVKQVIHQLDVRSRSQPI